MSWTLLENLEIATLFMWSNFNLLNKKVSTSCFDLLTFDLSTPHLYQLLWSDAVFLKIKLYNLNFVMLSYVVKPSLRNPLNYVYWHGVKIQGRGAAPFSGFIAFLLTSVLKFAWGGVLYLPSYIFFVPIFTLPPSLLPPSPCASMNLPKSHVNQITIEV